MWEYFKKKRNSKFSFANSFAAQHDQISKFLVYISVYLTAFIGYDLSACYKKKKSYSPLSAKTHLEKQGNILNLSSSDY